MIPVAYSKWWYGGLVVAFGFGWACASFYSSSATTSEIPSRVLERGKSRGTQAFSDNRDALPDRNSSVTNTFPVLTQPPGVDEMFREAMAISDSSDRRLRFQQLIATLSVEQMPAAVEFAKHLPGSDRNSVLEALGERWAKIDVKGAVALVMQHSDMSLGDRYGFFLNGVLYKWSNMAPADAVAWVRSLPPSGNRGEMVAKLVEAIGRNNPRYAFEILRGQVRPLAGSWSVENLFGSWAERDPQAAMAAASELKGSMSSFALTGLARVMAEKDPHAAIVWANNIKVPGDRREFINIVTEGWIKSDPTSVIAWSNSLEDQELRGNILSGAIAQLALSDMPAALAHIQRLPVGEEHDDAVGKTATSLSHRDLREAIKMLDQLPASPEKANRQGGVFAFWAESDPRAALDWFYKESSPGLDNFFVGNVLNSWMEQSPNEALAWVQALPAGEKRESAVTNLASRLVSSDPARAEQLFAELPSDAQASAANLFSGILVQRDLDRARSWAERLPAGPAQGTAFERIASAFAERNINGAAEWLEQLPAGLSRDRAIVGFSQTVVWRNPEAALSWALTIANERDRDQLVETLAKQWIGTDAAAARKWLRNSPRLTAEQRFRIGGE